MRPRVQIPGPRPNLSSKTCDFPRVVQAPGHGRVTDFFGTLPGSSVRWLPPAGPELVCHQTEAERGASFVDVCKDREAPGCRNRRLPVIDVSQHDSPLYATQRPDVPGGTRLLFQPLRMRRTGFRAGQAVELEESNEGVRARAAPSLWLLRQYVAAHAASHWLPPDIGITNGLRPSAKEL